MIPKPVFWLIDAVLNFYSWVVIVGVILSWLISFNVVNRRNQFVDMAWRFTEAMIEPVARPIRNRLPNLGGFDLSPVVILFAVMFLRWMNGWVALKIGF